VDMKAVWQDPARLWSSSLTQQAADHASKATGTSVEASKTVEDVLLRVAKEQRGRQVGGDASEALTDFRTNTEECRLGIGSDSVVHVASVNKQFSKSSSPLDVRNPGIPEDAYDVRNPRIPEDDLRSSRSSVSEVVSEVANLLEDDAFFDKALCSIHMNCL